MQDVLVFLSSNASPQKAPWGGIGRLFGNNPWSLSASARNFPCFMFDISNSAVVKGKLHHAKATDKLIPEGWTLDKQGYVATNPKVGIAILSIYLPQIDRD